MARPTANSLGRNKYRAVEDLIFKGFITTKVQVGDVTIVLKSLNLSELDLIAERSPLKTHSDYNLTFESLVLAYSIYMLDGENVLPQRPGIITDLVKEMREVPTNIRAELLEEVLLLQRAQDVELRRLEAYSYEPKSRHSWSSMKHLTPNDPRLTGIAGTDYLGLNSHQRAWVYLNQGEDDRLQVEQQWSFAKFVASAANAKGVKKIDQKDKARLKKLSEDREKVRQGMDYKGPERIERRSVDELRVQLEADLTGKKDLHDQIVEAYEASIAERRRAREAEQTRIIDEARAKRDAELEEMDNMTDQELAESLANGDGFVKVISRDQLEKMRLEQSERRNRWAREQQEARAAKSAQYKEDRQEIAKDLATMMRESEEDPVVTPRRAGPPARLDLPTNENGPVGPIDRRPRRPSTAPAAQPAPTPARPATAGPAPGQQRREAVSTAPSNQGELKTSQASKRLRRHNYGNPNQRRGNKPPNVKNTGTRVRHIEGEDDFFAGGGTTYGDDK